MRSAPAPETAMSREHLWEYVTGTNGIAARGRSNPQESGFLARDLKERNSGAAPASAAASAAFVGLAPRFARRAGLRGMLEKRRDPVAPVMRRSATQHAPLAPRSVGTAERDRDADFDGFSVVLSGLRAGSHMVGAPSSPALSFAVPTRHLLNVPPLEPTLEIREADKREFNRYLVVARAMFDAAPQSGGPSPDYAAAAMAALAAGGRGRGGGLGSASSAITELPSHLETPTMRHGEVGGFGGVGSNTGYSVHRAADDQGGAYELQETED